MFAATLVAVVLACTALVLLLFGAVPLLAVTLLLSSLGLALALAISVFRRPTMIDGDELATRLGPKGALLRVDAFGQSTVSVTILVDRRTLHAWTTLEGAAVVASRCRNIGSSLRLGGVPTCYQTPMRTGITAAIPVVMLVAGSMLAHSPFALLAVVAGVFLGMQALFRSSQVDLAQPTTWKFDGKVLHVQNSARRARVYLQPWWINRDASDFSALLPEHGAPELPIVPYSAPGARLTR
jgi:hypothetical protein